PAISNTGIRRTSSFLVSNRIHHIVRSDEEASAGDRGRRELARIEPVPREHARRAAGRNDDCFSVFAEEIDLPVGRNRGGGVNATDTLLEDAFAGLGVSDREDAD